MGTRLIQHDGPDYSGSFTLMQITPLPVFLKNARLFHANHFLLIAQHHQPISQILCVLRKALKLTANHSTKKT